jgi:hypothetical protein
MHTRVCVLPGLFLAAIMTGLYPVMLQKRFTCIKQHKAGMVNTASLACVAIAAAAFAAAAGASVVQLTHLLLTAFYIIFVS